MSLGEHTRKCLKTDYLGRIIHKFEKSRYTYPLDYKDSASTKKKKKTGLYACKSKAILTIIGMNQLANHLNGSHYSELIDPL